MPGLIKETLQMMGYPERRTDAAKNQTDRLLNAVEYIHTPRA